MIHHFRPARRVTSFQAVELRRGNLADIHHVVGQITPNEASRFTVEETGAIVHHLDHHQPQVYGGIGDPRPWWLIVDNLGRFTITQIDPYANSLLVPLEGH